MFSGLAAISGGRIFKATMRSSSLSRARMTAAMPPTPIGSINSKWARRPPRTSLAQPFPGLKDLGRFRLMTVGALSESGLGDAKREFTAGSAESAGGDIPSLGSIGPWGPVWGCDMLTHDGPWVAL